VFAPFSPYILARPTWRRRRAALQSGGMVACALVTAWACAQHSMHSIIRELSIFQRPTMLLVWCFALLPILQRLGPCSQLPASAAMALVSACVLRVAAPAGWNPRRMVPMLTVGIGAAVVLSAVCDARLRMQYGRHGQAQQQGGRKTAGPNH
jgi:hypothetical protein